MSRLAASHLYPLRHTTLAILALSIGLAAALSRPAFADDDPPSRVGRLAVIDGTVSFHTADQTTWGAATQNYPITTGNALWADSNAHAAVQIGANDINLGSQTELDIDQLTDQAFQASLPQGSVYLDLRGLNQGDQYQIATPRGTVNITQPGRYEISSGDQTHPSTVTVLEGAAQVSGDNNLNLPVGAGQSGVLSDNGQGGPVQANLAAANGQDDLIAWAQSRQPQAAPPPPEAAAMTGTQDLARYGSWNTSPDYGAVWYPQVQADWVPYRAGHWAWVAPWGWTWVDDAPWGFAPFHYGRWVQIGPRWAWAPRPVVVVAAPVVPVYAPALVSFVGDIGGVGIGISIGGPSVGWVPLGPREAYYPPYRVSPRYARNVNVTYVKNVNIINVHNTTVVRNVTVNNYVNHRAVTVVSRDAMTHSEHVSGAVQHVDQRDLDKMHGYNNSRAPFAPTAQTAGLTPTEAKHYGVAPQASAHNAAGPAINNNGNRNWAKFTPNSHGNQPSQINAANNSHDANGQVMPRQQNVQPQSGNLATTHWNNQNKWANQGSRKPGSTVQKQPALTSNGQVQTDHQQSQTGKQNPAVMPQAQKSGTTQAQQRKLNWANNQQSRQPGAAVQTSNPAQTNNAVQSKQNNAQVTNENNAAGMQNSTVQRQGQVKAQQEQNNAAANAQLSQKKWQQEQARQHNQQQQARQQQTEQRKSQEQQVQVQRAQQQQVQQQKAEERQAQQATQQRANQAHTTQQNKGQQPQVLPQQP